MVNSGVFTTKIDWIAFIFSLLSFIFEMCELTVPGDVWYKGEKYWSNVAASILVKLKAQMVKLEVPTKKSIRSTLIFIHLALNPRCVSQASWLPTNMMHQWPRHSNKISSQTWKLLYSVFYWCIMVFHFMGIILIRDGAKHFSNTASQTQKLLHSVFYWRMIIEKKAEKNVGLGVEF